VQALLDSGVIPALVLMVEREEGDIRKEIAWAISNATSGGDYFQIKQLVESGCIAPLVNLLDDSHVGMLVLGRMDEDKVVNVRRCRRFTTYTGYLDTYRITGWWN
jgi:hypothetical protein